MSDVRTVLAENGRRVVIFLGLAVMFIGGGLDVDFIAVLGLVVLVGGMILGDVVEDFFESSAAAATTDPVETLRDQYARGEIDETEFERRLDRLLETEPVDEQTKPNDGRLREETPGHVRERSTADEFA